jgi:hypothetical protein
MKESQSQWRNELKVASILDKIISYKMTGHNTQTEYQDL